MGRHPLLLVEDNPTIARVYLEYLRRGPYETLHCETGGAALAALGERSFAAVLLDIELPDISGMEILKWITQRRLNTAVVVITAHGSINVAVEAMREGASDFLVKPFAPERLFVTLDNALERANLRRIVDTLDTPDDDDRFCGFVGTSLAMRGVYRIIDIAAQSKAPVFITGESGTGKELAAEAVHRRSPRRDKPFIALNCAAFPKDLIESEIFGHVKGAFTGAVAEREGAGSRANGGTLFFDEICEMDIGLQAKLLRFIQTGTFQKVGGTQTEKVDVRFVSATNRDPLKAVEAGRFREDLYYRLYVMPLALPAMREREDDVLLIARRFLAEYSQEEGRSFQRFAPETEQILLNYAWPGNVRQLQNVMRQIVLMNDGDTVLPNMLPPPLAQGRTSGSPDFAAAPVPHGNGLDLAETATPLSFSLAELKRDLIELAMAATDGNVLQAAARLEISPSTLYRQREQYRPQERPGSRLRELKPLAQAESEMIDAALAAADGNISRAAAALGVNPSTLYRKMQSKPAGSP
ncbi:MAG TPA: sigma 54-interacting transcriptional regulator [Aliidongia sp.]|uniref:sigma 54-interacting transcriptional regulator n=1 Tax=Aliidongia sp. TaxID=1914230 RepID=UPI002DDD591D|nr:sigma 54-interacting transcriptional regulator [Aliidongia sp.]HEV2673737.1 sigma 54-interacting transcriptional regulator [Aliidongia sp.]